MIDLAKIKKHPSEAFVGAYLDQGLRQWIRKWCTENNTSVSALIRELLEDFRRNEGAP